MLLHQLNICQNISLIIISSVIAKLEFMLLNGFIIKKLEIFPCAFREISVMYSNTETKFVISLAPDTRLITGKELYCDKNLT